MGSNDPRVDLHRFYAIIYFGDEVLAVVAVSGDGDGSLQVYESLEAYHADQ